MIQVMQGSRTRRKQTAVLAAAAAETTPQGVSEQALAELVETVQVTVYAIGVLAMVAAKPECGFGYAARSAVERLEAVAGEACRQANDTAGGASRGAAMKAGAVKLLGAIGAARKGGLGSPVDWGYDSEAGWAVTDVYRCCGPLAGAILAVREELAAAERRAAQTLGGRMSQCQEEGWPVCGGPVLVDPEQAAAVAEA